MTALNKSIYAALLACLAGGAVLAVQAAEDDPAAERPAVTATVLYNSESVLGRRVTLASGENAGRITDVLADRNGHVRAAVIDYGGFLGVGSRKVAVAWSDLRFEPGPGGTAVAVDLPAGRLARAPTVKAWPSPSLSSARAGRPGIARP